MQERDQIDWYRRVIYKGNSEGGGLGDEIFPQELTRFLFPEEVYAQLKKRILSGKQQKGQRLSYDGIVHETLISIDGPPTG
jgi:hypothetical protein